MVIHALKIINCTYVFEQEHNIAVHIESRDEMVVHSTIPDSVYKGIITIIIVLMLKDYVHTEITELCKGIEVGVTL